MDAIIAFLNTLSNLSPLAVIALLGTVIFLLVKGKTSADAKVDTLATNHLHDLPTMNDNLEKIVEILQRMEVDMAKEFSYLRTRLNGRNRQ